MTALIFILEPDQIHVAMDTLVIDTVERTPLEFARKFAAIPEIDLLVAGTGHAGFIHGWFRHVESELDVEDVDELVKIAPDVLRVSASEGGLGSVSTTVYHFGFSRAQDCYVGYACRSTNDFRAERLSYGLGTKPQVSLSPTASFNLPDILIELMLLQQEQDRCQPIEDQVGIGGEIECVSMSDCTTSVRTVHRFASYDQERRCMESRQA